MIAIKLNRRQKTVIIAAVFVLLAGIFDVDPTKLVSIGKNLVPSPTAIVKRGDVKTAKVISVIDGDTFIIEGNQKVRYIGIDTPEIINDTSGKKVADECYARESYEENRRLIEGKTVRLERDVSDNDKYGRLLRYVYLDDIFVNQHLLSQGFAKLMTIKPDIKYYQSFKQVELKARAEGIGLWDKCIKVQP